MGSTPDDADIPWTAGMRYWLVGTEATPDRLESLSIPCCEGHNKVTHVL